MITTLLLTNLEQKTVRNYVFTKIWKWHLSSLISLMISLSTLPFPSRLCHSDAQYHYKQFINSPHSQMVLRCIALGSYHRLPTYNVPILKGKCNKRPSLLPIAFCMPIITINFQLTQRLTKSLWYQKLSSHQPFFKGFCTFEQVALINTIAVHIWQQSKHCIVGLLAKQNFNK